MAQPNNDAAQSESTNEYLRRMLGKNPKDPIHVTSSKETPLERSKRVQHYQDSGAVAYCRQCEKQLLLCGCTGLDHGKHVNFAWPSSYSREEKEANFKRWSEKFEQPVVGDGKVMFDLAEMTHDYLEKGIIRALSNKKTSLKSMMTEHVRNQSSQIKLYGQDAVMFLTDLNLLCGQQIHWVLLNNAFQTSDENKYSLEDLEWKLIFDLISGLMEITEFVKLWKEIIAKGKANREAKHDE